jgi:hypothetical protein
MNIWQVTVALILITVIACESTASSESSVQSVQSSTRNDLVIVSRADELNLIPNDFDLDWTFEPGTGAEEAKIRAYEADIGSFSATLPNIITSTVQVHPDIETAVRAYTATFTTVSGRSATKSKDIGNESYFWINGPVYEVTFRFKNVIGVVQSLATWPYEGSEKKAYKWAEFLAGRIADRGQLGPAATPTPLVLSTPTPLVLPTPTPLVLSTPTPALVPDVGAGPSATSLDSIDLSGLSATVIVPPSPTPRPTPTAEIVPIPTPNPSPVPVPTPVATSLVNPSPTPETRVLSIPTPRTGPTVTPAPADFAIISAYTGFYLDTSGETDVRRTNRRNSVELKFNAAIDPASVQVTDFVLNINNQTQHPTIASVGGPDFPDRIFLTLRSDLATNSAPAVTIVDTLTSIGRGQIAAGHVTAADAISPVITVILSGGSSTSLPAALTNDQITITITSDESLSSDPTIQIFDEGVADFAEGTVVPINKDGRTWIATFIGDEFVGSTADGRKKAVRVIANDSADISVVDALVDGDTAIPDGKVIGQTVVGGTDASESKTYFVLDKTAPMLSLTPSGPISDGNPRVEWDFGEKVSITELSFGTLGSPQDFSDIAGSFDQIVYFFPMSGLGSGTYVTIASVTDIAGNESVGLIGGFTVN